MTEATQAHLPVTPELLPCPFCGSAKIDPTGWRSLDAQGPACDDCGASAGQISLDHAENVAAWNTRSQSHSLPGDRETVASALHKKACGLLPTNAIGPIKDERSFWLSLADAALTPSALSPEPVQKLHELPEGHRWCRHCEQKDPHCSVCEGVGYLPSALSGGEVE
ncbi:MULTISPECIES: Lar family restriction alleviation protein [Alphaproteobacteria]|uniref:Lar family restriction alleviation protein n=1 Tax=Sphingopyxis sp. TaxID=1908224 RepID=UPI0040336DCC